MYAPFYFIYGIFAGLIFATIFGDPKLVCTLPKRKRKPKLVYIEGNVGAGKSTLLNKLMQDLAHLADFVREPVDIWTKVVDEQGKNILDKFINDQKRWAYTFHNIAFLTRMKLILEAIEKTDKEFIILDRSLMSDTITFAPVLHEDGFLDKFELDTYLMWNQFFNEHFSKDTDGYSIVYLRTPADVAFERIQKRARPEEKLMPKEYIEKLEKKHDDWLISNDEERVLIIDGDVDFEDNQEDYTFVKTKIEEFLTRMQ